MCYDLCMSISCVMLVAAALPDIENHPIRPDAALQARIDRAVATVQKFPWHCRHRLELGGGGLWVRTTGDEQETEENDVADGWIAVGNEP